MQLDRGLSLDTGTFPLPTAASEDPPMHQQVEAHQQSDSLPSTHSGLTPTGAPDAIPPQQRKQQTLYLLRSGNAEDLRLRTPASEIR